jgi:predicted small metal-binding protein
MEEDQMARVMADCRRFPSDINCSLTIIGEEDEVLEAAVQHAVSAHGHEDTPELREQTKALLEPESAYAPGEREKEPLPGS